MIEIKTTKIVSKNGKKQYRIESIKGVISKDLLPSDVYLKGKPCFWRNGEIYTLDNTAGYIYMYRGIVIAEKFFLEIIEDIKRAGIQLHILNNEKREIEKTWKGEDTFII